MMNDRSNLWKWITTGALGFTGFTVFTSDSHAFFPPITPPVTSVEGGNVPPVTPPVVVPPVIPPVSPPPFVPPVSPPPVVPPVVPPVDPPHVCGTPEPATAVSAGLGLAMLAAWRLRRRGK